MKLTSDTDKLARSLDKSGVCYLHAPFFSPALKSVATARKSLAVRTFFNMLGPLVNPVQPKHQLLGVYSLKLMRLYSYIAQNEGIACTVVHSLDGYDEISLTAPFKISGSAGERIYTPDDLGWNTATQNELRGGETIADAAAIFDAVLDGKATQAQENCVIANSAFSLITLDPKLSIEEASDIACESIHSGAARKVFNKFCEINR